MALPAGAKAPEPIRLPDVRRLDRMPSLPAWVASRIASVRDEEQKPPPGGKYRSVPTLPENLTLSPAERAEIEQHVAALESLCRQMPCNDDKWEEATLITVTKMMLALPSVQQSDIGAEATGEALQAALDDVPHWAVTAAVRLWYRGNCGLNARGEEYDYHWRPAPAELRRIAFIEWWRIRGRVHELRRLLAAEPLIEFSDAHCKQMQQRMAKSKRDSVMSTDVPVG